jgi:hypothetical protein
MKKVSNKKGKEKDVSNQRNIKADERREGVSEKKKERESYEQFLVT